MRARIREKWQRRELSSYRSKSIRHAARALQLKEGSRYIVVERCFRARQKPTPGSRPNAPNEISHRYWEGGTLLFRTVMALLTVMALSDSCAVLAAAPASARACTFEALTPEDRRRYQSRYTRRLEGDGKAVADHWLHEQVCMTPAQRAARRRPLVGKDGRPCTRTRLEMRATPGWDGAMNMSPIPVCTL